MGRITVFTDHDVHSLQMKHELSRRKIPFTEINLSEHPHKRQDLFSLTRRLTTPSAFFNTRSVGDLDATVKLLKEWDRDKKFQGAAKKYEAQIGKFPDPGNPHLSIPEPTPESNTNTVPIEPITVELELPSGIQTYRVSELQEELARALPLSTLPYHLVNYRNSITGTQATSALKKHFNCSDRQEAEEIGKKLNKLGLFWHVCYDHDFSDTDKLYFRLQCHQTPEVLNSLCVLNGQTDSDVEKANGLVERLEYLLYQLEKECFNLEKGGIEYSRGASCRLFSEIQEGICHFQTVSIADMTPHQLLVC